VAKAVPGHLKYFLVLINFTTVRVHNSFHINKRLIEMILGKFTLILSLIFLSLLFRCNLSSAENVVELTDANFDEVNFNLSGSHELIIVL
jgi:hypothetical protein